MFHLYSSVSKPVRLGLSLSAQSLCNLKGTATELQRVSVKYCSKLAELCYSTKTIKSLAPSHSL